MDAGQCHVSRLPFSGVLFWLRNADLGENAPPCLAACGGGYGE